MHINKLPHQLPMYAIAGLITLLVEYGSFLFMFYVIGTVATVANVTSFTVSLTINLLLNKQLVFRVDNAGHSWHKQTALYFCLAFCNLAITTIGLYYLPELGIPAFAAKLVFVCLVASWNFIIFKQIIFRRKDSKSE